TGIIQHRGIVIPRIVGNLPDRPVAPQVDLPVRTIPALPGDLPRVIQGNPHKNPDARLMMMGEGVDLRAIPELDLPAVVDALPPGRLVVVIELRGQIIAADGAQLADR